jgi:two-component system, OmpR family, response regulator ChvI
VKHKRLGKRKHSAKHKQYNIVIPQESKILLKNRILIVDDEPDIAQVLKMGLEKNGFAVDAYNDPLDVISNFKTGSYDLLLLDIKMPKMNGFELYNKLRQIDEKARICFITAYELYFDEFKRIFPKIKVGCFIRKPVSIGNLARVIKEELQQEDSSKDKDVQK